MQFDSSIWNQYRPLDIAGNISQGMQEGMKMRELMDQRNKNQSLQEAYKAGNGDAGATMKELMARGHNKEAMEMQDRANSQEKFNQEKHLHALDMISRVAPAIKDQDSYTQALKTLGDQGIDVSKMPAAYDPNLVNKYSAMALSAKDKLAHEEKMREFDERMLDRKDAREERRALFGEREKDRKEARDAKAKEVNTAQAKQVANYEMGQAAEQQYKDAITPPDKDGLFGGGYDPTSSGQFIDNSKWAPNFLKNNNAIKAQAAQDNWIETFLRDASGAAIAPSERSAYASIYFPQPGDPQDVVANKEALRKQKMDAALIGAGSAGQRIVQEKNSSSGSTAKSTPKFNPNAKPTDKLMNKVLPKANASTPQIFKTHEIEWAD
jgi:hypothetical protein